MTVLYCGNSALLPVNTQLRSVCPSIIIISPLTHQLPTSKIKTIGAEEMIVFTLKNVAFMCMLLHLSLKENSSIHFKSNNLGFKGQKVALPTFAHQTQEYSEEIR